ncbi:MAG TPA: anthrone oxygenase family protein [Blastocatellia bacterium]|jgi:uncharacterized membrane protein|nr:anthrone oxygenase family protein [Blastocatellia bacterium]
MIDKVFFALTLVAALGCGLVGGAFFAFSTFVMSALARLPAAQGIAAMQSVNVTIINPLCGVVFLGTAATCVLLAVSLLLRRHEPGAAYILAGSLLYLVGVILVTGLFNVPRNNALAAVNPSSAEGAKLWTDYLSGWTAWNHVRTVASLAAAALLIIALVWNKH